jgi:dipeptidyl aminopeptidase/acylaminoacyl peptidase
MFKPKGVMFLTLVISLMVIVPLVDAQEPTRSEREAMYYKYLNFASYVKGGSIQPHWMADGSSFWYAEGAPANTVIYKIDPKANTKTPLFNTEQLRQALTAVLGHEPPYQGLPFDKFTFIDGEKAVKFSVEGKEFILQLDTYSITRVPALSEAEKSRLVPQLVRKSSPRREPDVMEVLSPDRRWFASLKEHDLWLRSTYDGRSVQLTTDGIEEYEWGSYRSRWALWSPDSVKLALKKVDYRQVPKRLIVHWLKPEEEVEWVHTPREGGEELFIVDILSKRHVRVDTGEQPDQYIYLLGWQPDGSELLFLRVKHTWKKLDLMAANPTTGTTRVILTENEKTWVGIRPARAFTPLGGGKKFIWMSERDRWLHLYLYDLDGTLIRRLTQGAFPVVRVIAVDEKAGWVYFTAHGNQQRPYDTHLYRVSLEGKGFTQLTEATGEHAIQFPPSKEFFLDRHSTPDRPPVVELRRADGTLLQTLSRANIDAAQELKWTPPEEFVVKAADGKTDLYGILYKPYDFDPNKKYPVIEDIYAGPQMTWVPRTFTAGTATKSQALAQLGFITFRVDGRGTPERGKEFQDVVYGNFGRHEIPDHMAALKQLAEKRPDMDLSRVGIIGGSWGASFTIRALLFAPDVYHVGIAVAGRSGPIGLGGGMPTRYMGLPQNNPEGYEYGSNLRFVAHLKGKLLLVIGTSDYNFSGTMKMVEALIRAGKPYDLLVFPEQVHRTRSWTRKARTYYRDAVRRYFQEHLKPDIED